MNLDKFIKDACLVEFKKNTIDKVDPGYFGYFVDDFEKAKKFKNDNPHLYPYTLVTGDYGSAYIIEGWHIVNRMAYCFGEVDVGKVDVKYWEEDEGEERNG